MSCLQQIEWASGNIYIRPVHLARAGDECGNHAHNFDHTTIILKGAVRIAKDGIDQEFFAPSHCLIEKGIRHLIVALEDDTEFWCVYSHRSPQGEVVQEFNGWLEAYN